MCYPYRPHGDRKNRPDPLQRNGSWRFVSMIHPSRIPTVYAPTFGIMYYFHPLRLAKSSIAKQNLSHHVNAVCSGSPSRIRRVRRISLGITTRPRSSMRRTMPVAFINCSSNAFRFAASLDKSTHVLVKRRCWLQSYCLHAQEKYAGGNAAVRALVSLRRRQVYKIAKKALESLCRKSIDF